jgi:Glycosyl hydrolase catalytic core
MSASDHATLDKAVRLLSVLLVAGLAGWVGVRGARGASPSKRGIASAKYLRSDPAKLDQLNVSWAYDWSSQLPPESAGGHVQWVPMVWGAASVTRQVISALTADRKRGRAVDLLGFNEPDNASQSNMTPLQAADLWPRLESTGLQLGAPAPAVPGDGWLARFMKLVRARHLRVDFLTVHVYQDFTDASAVSQLKQELRSLYATYHRPIWVTELGTIDIRTWGDYMERTPTYALAERYMKAVTAMLNALPFVQRYAWFSDNCWSTPACRYGSLFNGRNQLTPIGRAYARAGG